MNIKSLKATRAGRAMTRLFGEEQGAVLMEYVVLGVLIVAAVVGMVIAFGNRTNKQVQVMIETVEGKPNTAQATVQAADAAAAADISAAQGTHTVINGGEINN